MKEHRPKKLLDQVRDAIRLTHYSYRTEQAYVGWINRYIHFHDMRHPSEMGAPEVQVFLTHLARPREIAIVGDPNAADTQAPLEVVRTGYRPHQVVAAGAPGTQPGPAPLLQGRDLVEGRAAAYVCWDHSCQAPVTEAAALKTLLQEG